MLAFLRKRPKGRHVAGRHNAADPFESSADRRITLMLPGDIIEADRDALVDRVFAAQVESDRR